MRVAVVVSFLFAFAAQPVLAASGSGPRLLSPREQITQALAMNEVGRRADPPEDLPVDDHLQGETTGGLITVGLPVAQHGEGSAVPVSLSVGVFRQESVEAGAIELNLRW